jgi:hypothetical protein
MLPTSKELLLAALDGDIATVWVDVDHPNVDVGFFRDAANPRGILTLNLSWAYKNDMTVDDDGITARLSRQGQWHMVSVPLGAVRFISNMGADGEVLRAVVLPVLASAAAVQPKKKPSLRLVPVDEQEQ